MDRLLLAERKISKIGVMFAVVCDGVGSMTDGAYASSESVRMLNEWFARIDNTERVGLRLRDEVQIINERITESTKSLGLESATTLSALLIIDKQIHIVHAGDSRIYVVDKDILQQLTVDAVTEAGHLTTFIGRNSNVDLFYAEGQATGNVFLLCSDGLYKRLPNDDPVYSDIDTSNKKSISKSLALLTETAIKRGERDNISVALIKLKEK